MTVRKQKDGRDGIGYKFRLKTVPLYTDNEGEEVDSCFVDYIGSINVEVPENKNEDLYLESDISDLL